VVWRIWCCRKSHLILYGSVSEFFMVYNMYLGFFDKHGFTYWCIYFFSVHCKHVQCNTLIFTPSTNADLLNIKRKGDPKSRTLSRTSDIIETRNPCVIKVIVLACSTYIDIFWNFIKTRLTYWQESFFFVEVNSNNTAPSIGNIAKPLKKHVPDISRPKKSRQYCDALDEREIGR
jgi:hypothetical protein